MKTRNKKQLVADPQCGQSIIINAGVDLVHGLTITQLFDACKRFLDIPAGAAEVTRVMQQVYRDFRRSYGV